MAKYMEIAKEIEEAIREGKYPPNSRLPSLTALLSSMLAVKERSSGLCPASEGSFDLCESPKRLLCCQQQHAFFSGE